MDRKILIEQAIQQHIASGGMLIRWSFNIQKTYVPRKKKYAWAPKNAKACCGLSCYLLTRMTKNESEIEVIYGRFEKKWSLAFMKGFDSVAPLGDIGTLQTLEEKDAFEFGQLMWQKYGNKNG